MKQKLLLGLSLAGFIVAIIAALESKVPYLANLCGFLGDGCSDTTGFLLLNMPVAWWGIAYYAILSVVIMKSEKLTFSFVMAGVGCELTLVKIMISGGISCAFCLMNLGIIILLLALLLLKPERFIKEKIWQGLSICFLMAIITALFIVLPLKHRQSVTSVFNKNDAVANVGGHLITAFEMEQPISGRLYQVEKELYTLKKKNLDKLIQMKLIGLEAEKKGTTADAILDEVLGNNKDQASDDEVNAHYNSNKEWFANSGQSIKEIKKQLKTYLSSIKSEGLLKSYTKPLREEFGVEVFLNKPALPYSEVDITDCPSMGPENAPVTIIEFSDYLCPSCQKGHSLVEKIKKTYAGKIRWVYKDYPLKRHPKAKEMAEAAHCAGEQGKFWEYQDLLYSIKGTSSVDTLFGIAKKLNLDIDAFSQSFNSGKYRDRVQKNITQATESGISSTPTFVINGRHHPGMPSEKEFKKMIDDALN